MPRKDGFEVLEWIRGQPSLQGLIVVVLSSSRQDRDISRAYELGANSYVVKPNDYEGLIEMTRVLVTYWLNWSKFPAAGTAGLLRRARSARRRGIRDCKSGRDQ